MRIALDTGTDIGKRAARILLAGSRCESLLMLNADWLPPDPRVAHSTNLTGVDVIVSDGTTALTNLVGRASVARSPLVVWQDVDQSEFGSATIPVVVGANVGSTLADCLLTHPASQPAAGETYVVAWTEPGEPVTSGTAVGFPEPVGMSWCRRRAADHFVAFRTDEWAAAVTIVEGDSGTRIVGVSDLGEHLEALTLVAVAFVAASGLFEPAIQSSADALAAILEETRTLELDVAVWRSTS